jgi:hypothetical protein
MKYILTIIFSLALVSPVYAFETPWQTFITGEGSNAGILTTDINGILMQAPIANPATSTTPFIGTQTITLSAPGAASIHYFKNTKDLPGTLSCSNASTTIPIIMEGSGLIRAIACYSSVDGLVAGPMASFNYVIAPPANNNTPASSSGGGGGYTPPATPPTTDQADFDDSGDVDILDFNILISNWGTATGATKATGDADGNGTIDIFDFNILITNWSV